MTKPVTPLLTVDIIIELTQQPEQTVVLIERKYPPYGWALPGGFVDVGELLETAAIREAKEETNLDISVVRKIGVYDDIDRDPRGRIISNAFLCKLECDISQMKGDQESEEIKIVKFEDIKEIDLAFDHEDMLKDAKLI